MKGKEKLCTVLLGNVRRIPLNDVEVLEVQPNHHLIVTDINYISLLLTSKNISITAEGQVVTAPGYRSIAPECIAQRLTVEPHHRELGVECEIL